MKYDKFLTNYQLTQEIPGNLTTVRDAIAREGLAQIKKGVYNKGLYTFISDEESKELLELVKRLGYKKDLKVFAVDWIGKIFALDPEEKDKNGCETISCYDLSAPSSSFCTQVNFEIFHNVHAVNHRNELFDSNRFDEWSKSNQPPNDGKTCVGYKVPLFLGGKDDFENMELTDRSVYLHLQAQLFSSING